MPWWVPLSRPAYKSPGASPYFGPFFSQNPQLSTEGFTARAVSQGPSWGRNHGNEPGGRACGRIQRFFQCDTSAVACLARPWHRDHRLHPVSLGRVLPVSAFSSRTPIDCIRAEHPASDRHDGDSPASPAYHSQPLVLVAGIRRELLAASDHWVSTGGAAPVWQLGFYPVGSPLFFGPWFGPSFPLP